VIVDYKRRFGIVGRLEGFREEIGRHLTTHGLVRESVIFFNWPLLAYLRQGR
jgi:hypothetical protein